MPLSRCYDLPLIFQEKLSPMRKSIKYGKVGSAYFGIDAWETCILTLGRITNPYYQRTVSKSTRLDSICVQGLLMHAKSEGNSVEYRLFIAVNQTRISKISNVTRNHRKQGRIGRRQKARDEM